MMYNLFVVRSPLQLINAIEAKEHFKTKNNILLLMNNNPNDHKQLDTVLKLSTWDEIVHYKPQTGSTFRQQIKLIRSMMKRSYEYVFSGDYGTVNQVMLANLSVEDIYLIDDGTMSIEIHKKLQDPEKVSYSKKLKLLRYRFFGLQTSIKQTINFFTCYNLHIINNEKIVQNEYQYLQSIFKPKTNEAGITYLLGQNLDNNWMKQGRYISYLRHIQEHFNTKIIYMPHRHEVITDELQALFDENFILQHNTIPIEIYFLEKGIYPKHIISFTSSALFNLQKIYKQARIDAILIRQEDLIKMQDFVKSCYDFFKPLNINLINLFEKEQS